MRRTSNLVAALTGSVVALGRILEGEDGVTLHYRGRR